MGEKSMEAMLGAFEQMQNQVRQPNIIILKVERDDKGGAGG